MKKTTKQLIVLLLAIVLLTAPLTAFAATQEDDYVTRGQFASLVADVFQLPTAPITENFYDVPSYHQHVYAISRVNAFNIMVGNSSGYFFPDAIISGAEAAVWLNNMIGFDGTQVAQVTDLSVPSWAVPSISVILDLAMVDSQLIERPMLRFDEATRFINAAVLALMIAPGTPYALQQAELQNNFFAYVNRQFLATGIIPPGGLMASAFSDVSSVVAAQQEVILSGILNNPNLEAGSDEWKIRELYNMFLDTNTRAASISLLEPYFDVIRNIESIEELLELAREYSDYINFVPFYSMSFMGDARNDATQWAVSITASPLSFGSRDLYLNDPALAPLHTAYIDLTATLLRIAGETENVQERAEAIFALEQERAARMHPPETWADISNHFVSVDWEDVLEATSVTQNLSFNEALFERARELAVYSADLDYINFINSLYVEDNLQVILDYTLVMFLMSYISVLDDAYSGLTDEFMSIMFGQPMGGDLTIEDRGQQLVTSVMWRTFSRAYYEQFSSSEIKQDVTDMTEDIRAIMRDMIKDIPWMTPETRLASIEKLDAVTAFIAFPDEVIYELAFDVRPQSDGGNLIDFIRSTARLNNEMWLELLDMPANISIWHSVPTSTVNAFYNPMENAIIIPAGILQYPFYCITSTREQNLGAIGAVIAHEFVHAFDPMGSQFDKYGTMSDWWTAEDVEAFAERNARVIGILNSIEFAGMNLIGALNVNETVTDLGAMEVVMTVAATMEDANPALVMEAWARIWAARMTPEVAHFLMMNTPHLPAMLRTNFILAQLDEFYEVFEIVAGNDMYIPVEERISFWR